MFIFLIKIIFNLQIDFTVLHCFLNRYKMFQRLPLNLMENQVINLKHNSLDEGYCSLKMTIISNFRFTLNFLAQNFVLKKFK